MRKIRLTESQLHRVIINTAKKLIREMAEGRIISDAYLEDYKAQDIADSEGITEENEEGLTPEEQGAVEWFNGIDISWEEYNTPLQGTFITEMPQCGGSLYRDYTGGYFLMKSSDDDI